MTQTSAQTPPPQASLPADPTVAVRTLTALVKELIEVMERESHALAMQDGVGFTAVQDRKQDVLARYESATAAFRARLPEFRCVDRALLDRLDALQRDLAARTQDNMDAMERMGAVE